MPKPKTFAQYLRVWFAAVRKGAVDTFGTYTTLVGFGLWIWSKRWPNSFKAVAAYLRVTPEAALSDFVWQIPLVLGGVALTWRFIRAPYEIYRAQETEHEHALQVLNRQLAATREHAVGIEHGGYYLSAKQAPCVLPGVWIVCYDVVITNHTDRQLPLELWLYVGMRADGSWRLGEVCSNIVPAWAVEEHLEHQVAFDRLLNLPARSAEHGYCATRFGYKMLEWAGANEKELVEQRPFWLEVKNKLTDQSQFHALNYIARDVDRKSTSK